MSDKSIVPTSPASNNSQQFNFNGFLLRAIPDNSSNPWFVAADICKPLAYSNVAQTVRDHVDDEDKGYVIFSGTDIPSISPRYTPGSTLVVNESGPYALILGSQQPNAKAFKRFVTSEVLPAIRKTNRYIPQSAQSMTPVEQFKALVAYMEQTQAQIEDIHEKLGENSLAIESVVDRLDDAEYLTVKQFCARQRINVTNTVRSGWGKLAGEISRARASAIYSAIEDGRPVGRYHESVLLDVCRPKPNVSSRQLKLPEDK